MKKDSQAKILDAALVTFSKNGYQGTSIPQIAKAAKMAVGSIYVHFDNKEALVNALYIHWKKVFLQKLQQVPQENLSTKERFDYFWQNSVDFVNEHPQAFLFLEGHHHAPYMSKEALKIEAEVWELARAFVQHCQDCGDMVKAEADTLISLVFGTLVQLHKQSSLNPKVLSEKNLALAKNLCWKALSSH